MTKSKKRKLYLITFLLIFTMEILIAVYVNDNFVRPYIGDVLVVVLIYCFFKIFFPGNCLSLPPIVTAFAVFVEILQAFNIVDKLGLGVYPLARIIIGTTFDFRDILCYIAGGLIAYGWEYVSGRQTDI